MKLDGGNGTYIDNDSNQKGVEALIIKDTPDQFSMAIPLFLATYPSAHTRENYERHLKEFKNFWFEQNLNITKLGAIERFHIDGWQRHLEKNLSSASVCAKVSALISFTRFIFENGWTTSDPGAFIKVPVLKNQKGKTEALSEDTAKQILEALEKNYKAASDPFYNKEHYRAWLHYGLFLTFITVGMRASELSNLKICDLKKSNKYYRLNISLKGGQEHFPLVPDYLSSYLLSYIKNCRRYATPEDPIFTVTATGKNPIGRVYISYLIKKIAADCNVEGRVSAHSLRATVASALHKNKVPVGEIKDLLGHSSIVTTMRYVRRTDEENESAALKNTLVKSHTINNEKEG